MAKTGFSNGVMFAENVNFSSSALPSPTVTTDGQLLIGSTVAPNIRVGTLTSTGGTLTITPGAGTINLDLAGGSVGVDSVAVQATTAPGVSPVLPTGGGLMTVNGAAVAAQLIPVQTRSIALNSYQTEVQRASSSAVTNATQQGIASFNSAHFLLDANGWVSSLNGLPASAFDVDANTAPGTDPVLPSALGVVTVAGAQVAAGANPVRTNSLAANSYQIQVQRSSAQAVSTLTANGIAHFNSAQFTVDANGFVSSLAGTAPWIDSAGGALVNHTGYFATAAAAYTLPAGVANGDMIEIVDFIGGGVAVTAQGGDLIRLGNVDSSVNGTATSTILGDALRLVYRAVGQVWVQCPGSQGVWVLA